MTFAVKFVVVFEYNGLFLHLDGNNITDDSGDGGIGDGGYQCFCGEINCKSTFVHCKKKFQIYNVFALEVHFLHM